jgi:hypothetical protein
MDMNRYQFVSVRTIASQTDERLGVILAAWLDERMR